MRILLILTLCMTLIPSGLIHADTVETDGHNMLLFYSNDVLGETEPCG